MGVNGANFGRIQMQKFEAQKGPILTINPLLTDFFFNKLPITAY